MSDIKDIIPEKDWRKVKIQDYPATATPQNVPSEHFFNGMSGAIKDLESVSINRLVADSSGWTVVEFPERYVEMTKVFYADSVSFSAVGGVFSRTLEESGVSGGMSFPYDLKSIKEISINTLPNVGKGAGAGVWHNHLSYTLSKINSIRFSSDTSSTRNIRFSVTVKGFR